MEREERKRECVNEKARGRTDDYFLLSGIKYMTKSTINVKKKISLGERSEPHTGVFNRDFA